MEKATFAAGCFWGVEQAIRELDGVVDARVGYIGGHTENPTYKQVCTDGTGHAEAVEVTFDPEKVSYAELLDYFFRLHDPTTLNRQGPDVGSQYRSAIFTHSDAQAQAAEAAKAELAASGKFGDRTITTVIEPAPTFWEAEEYHQRYFEKNGGGGCHIVR
ncbi:peptide-methionine (S)-S-oxide reductase MsrA [bacterium]|nr:peptide-methionine (S)-S-oxide reductase MsrA [bacterium]